MSRGLTALARVHAVREQDSRIGFGLALADVRAAEATVEQLLRQLAGLPGALDGATVDLVGARLGIVALDEDLRAARADLDVRREVARAARDRWHADKARLSAVERLLAAREASVRAEQARREAKAADDIASQRWLRSREAAS